MVHIMSKSDFQQQVGVGSDNPDHHYSLETGSAERGAKRVLHQRSEEDRVASQPLLTNNGPICDDIYHQAGANIQSSDKVGLDRGHPTVPVTSSIHEELDSAAAFLRNNPFKADTNGSATVIYPNRLAHPASMAKTNPQIASDHRNEIDVLQVDCHQPPRECTI